MTSISPISPASTPILPQSNKVASDGDSAAVEAKETRAVKLDEKFNGGVTPKNSAPETTATPSSGTGGLSTVA